MEIRELTAALFVQAVPGKLGKARGPSPGLLHTLPLP